MTEEPTQPNRKARRAAGETEKLDEAAFLRLADKFIDIANRENKKIRATEIHMAFLFAASRYNAHVAKAVFDVDQHEEFVGSMTKVYQEMLRQHLGDQSLNPADDDQA